MPLNKAAAALAAGGLLLATFAGAAVLLGTPRIQLHDQPSEADQVTLYQSGLAFIGLGRDFLAPGGEALLTFAVPTTAIFDSLRIIGQGVEVIEVRSTLAERPVLEVGDRVAVHLDGEVFRGTILSLDEGQAALSKDGGGFALLDLGKAQAVEVEGRSIVEAKPGSAEVTALVKAPAGNHTVRLSYLARGPGWEAVHKMDAATGAWAFEAVLTGLEDWADVELDLVAGSPNVVYTPSLQAKDFAYDERATMAGLAAAGAPSADGFSPSTPLGDLHRYHLQRPVDLAKGETVRLPVLDGTVQVLRNYYEATGSTGWGGLSGDRQLVTVRERSEIKNVLPEPLQPGLVRFYREDTWIGDDALPAVPKGDRANVTLALAQDVKAKVVLESVRSTGDRDTYTYALVVENFKDRAVDLRATMGYGTYRTNLLRAEPAAEEQQGGMLAWNDALEPGASKTYRITYEQLRNY